MLPATAATAAVVAGAITAALSVGASLVGGCCVGATVDSRRGNSIHYGGVGVDCVGDVVGNCSNYVATWWCLHPAKVVPLILLVM